jgi:hypothetical protein
MDGGAMDCKRWGGVPPEAISSCRKGLEIYKGCVVAICEDCYLACVWDKRAWAGKIAQDFSKRKITIGRLKDAIREVESEDPMFIML